jgi:hypothetical protein
MGKLQIDLEATATDLAELEPMILVPLIDKIDGTSRFACICGRQNGLGSGGDCGCGSVNGGGN